MNTYSAHSPKLHTFDWAKALLVSLGVHLLLVALWVGAILLEVFAGGVRDLAQDSIKADEYVTIPLEIVEAIQRAQPTPPPVQEPEPPTKTFQPTRANQETTEAVVSDRYFGERSTVAASNGEVVENGLEVPTQGGRESRGSNDLELTNSDFADGEATGAPGLPGEPIPLSPAALVTENPPQEESEKSESVEVSDLADDSPLFEASAPSEPSAQEQLEMAQALAAELLSLEASIPTLQEEEEEKEEEEEETPEPKEETAPEETIPEPKQKATPPQLAGGVTGNRGLDGGFGREARQTRISGTIRRRGESALNVEDSIKGRFFAQINREIEKAWQRECILRREHILPGVLSVSFSISETGKVSNFRFDSRIAGGAIQEGFTMIAIKNKAKLPDMPEEIQKDLDGDLLEMNLTFFF